MLRYKASLTSSACEELRTDPNINLSEHRHYCQMIDASEFCLFESEQTFSAQANGSRRERRNGFTEASYRETARDGKRTDDDLKQDLSD